MNKSLLLSLVLTAACTLFAASAPAGQDAAAPAQQVPAAKPGPKAAAPAAKAQAPATARKPGAAAAKPATPLTTPKAKASYAIGANIGKSMKKEGVELDPALLARGIRDGISGGKLLLTDEEAQAALMAFSAEMRKKQEAKQAEMGDANKKEGDAFLAANKAKAGIVTLPSGLEYKILAPGTGPKPAPDDTVVCNYRGILINGTEFDSSYKRGQPATFPVTGVIKGWTEALQLMPVGSKWQLIVPPDLAYGQRGAGADIGPNATLIFEVELLSIQEKAKEPAKDPAKPVPPSN